MNKIKRGGVKFISILSRTPVDKWKVRIIIAARSNQVRNFIDHAIRSRSSWLQLRKREKKKRVRENRIEKETRSCPIFFFHPHYDHNELLTRESRGGQLWSPDKGGRNVAPVSKFKRLSSPNKEKKKKRKEEKKIEGDNIVVKSS